MRQHTQLRLRVVGTEQYLALIGNKRASDFLTQFGSNRNILQVRIRRSHTAGSRTELLKSSVNALVAIKLQRQRFYISIKQFGDFSIFENKRNYLVLTF